jgi:hypothetical protein
VRERKLDGVETDVIGIIGSRGVWVNSSQKELLDVEDAFEEERASKVVLVVTLEYHYFRTGEEGGRLDRRGWHSIHERET